MNKKLNIEAKLYHGDAVEQIYMIWVTAELQDGYH